MRSHRNMHSKDLFTKTVTACLLSDVYQSVITILNSLNHNSAYKYQASLYLIYHSNKLMAAFTLYLDTENVQKSAQKYYDESNTYQYTCTKYEQ